MSQSSSRSNFIRSIVGSFLFALPLFTMGCADGFFASYESPIAAGKRLYAQQDYAAAAGSFRTAVRKDPRDWEGEYLLGVACEADGRYHEAIEAFRACLDIMSVSYDGKSNTAFRLKAIDALAKTVAKNDSHDIELNRLETDAKQKSVGEGYFILAKTYRYCGDADMALENYQRASNLDPRNFELLKEYGLYLQQAGKSQDAAGIMERAYRLKTDDAEVIAVLRQNGVVPGPSLKERNELARPLIPKGPLDFQKFKSSIGLGPKDEYGAPVNTAVPASNLVPPRD